MNRLVVGHVLAAVVKAHVASREGCEVVKLSMHPFAYHQVAEDLAKIGRPSWHCAGCTCEKDAIRDGGVCMLGGLSIWVDNTIPWAAEGESPCEQCIYVDFSDGSVISHGPYLVDYPRA